MIRSKGQVSPVLARWPFLAICTLLSLFAACRQDMYNQPKAKPYSASEFFRDGTSARPLPEHTVQYHEERGSDEFSTGLTNGFLVAQLPVALTPELLARGRERYGIYCAVCHGAGGDGQGEVVRRGFPAPPTFHSDRMRNAPIGHYFDVITHGYGVMYSYAARVDPHDRWAIAAYIRALQLSQGASVGLLAPNERRRIEEAR